MLLGNIDVNGPVAEGWAFDTESTQDVIVDIYVDEKRCLSLVVGNEVRQDVRDNLSPLYNVGSYNCGFKIDLTSHLSKAGSKIEFRFNKTNQLINGSNGTIICPPYSSRCIIDGDEGYRFFAGEQYEVLKQLAEPRNFSEYDVMMWSQRYCLLNASTSAHGGQFVPVVVPEKIAVAPNLLSSDFCLSDRRLVCAISQFAAHLYGIEVLYPLSDLRKNLSQSDIMTKTDSHLSWRAHHYIFELILERLSLNDYSYDVNWSKRSYVHDLSIFLGSNSVECEDMPEFIDSGTVVAIESRGTNCFISLNPLGRIPIVFICGHSSCKMLEMYVRQISRMCIYCHGKTLDERLIAELKPDLVIHYLAERNLHNAGSEMFIPLSAIDRQMLARAIEVNHRLGATLGKDIVPDNDFGTGASGLRAPNPLEQAEALAGNMARRMQRDRL